MMKVRMDMPDSRVGNVPVELLDLLPGIVLLPHTVSRTSERTHEQQRDAADQAESRHDQEFLRRLGIRECS